VRSGEHKARGSSTIRPQRRPRHGAGVAEGEAHTTRAAAGATQYRRRRTRARARVWVWVWVRPWPGGRCTPHGRGLDPTSWEVRIPTGWEVELHSSPALAGLGAPPSALLSAGRRIRGTTTWMADWYISFAASGQRIHAASGLRQCSVHLSSRTRLMVVVFPRPLQRAVAGKDRAAKLIARLLRV
jgi:hypothetical protein